jgi:GT2 family glycosyltransferase
MFVGALVIRRDVLVAVGGYDERFEGYGGEDRELKERLERQDFLGVAYDAVTWLDMRRTPNSKRFLHYQLGVEEMAERSAAVRAENQERELLVANAGIEWGRA